MAEGVIVEDERGGEERVIWGREIVVCAGAVGSPQLLILRYFPMCFGCFGHGCAWAFMGVYGC